MCATLNDAGLPTAVASYDAWGVPETPLIGRFGFTGELQRGSDVWLRARWYGAGRGAFGARDPYAGDVQTPYSMQYYQYGYSNPVSLRDPSGKAPCIMTDVGVGPCIGGGGTGTLPWPPVDTKKAVEVCLTFLAYLGIQAQTDVQPQSRNDVPVLFYRGVTYYDGLRIQQDGFDSGGSLRNRQYGRDMDPGLYTTRNKEVAKYFAYLNSHPFLGSPGQGGPALLSIMLTQKKFQELTTRYAIIDNRPIEGLPVEVAQPHVETLFPYESLAELFMSSSITVELLN